MVEKQNEILKCDVLCIGGGPAGLMAAIRASDLGADVVVAEKGNTNRSGCATGGCDHFACYNPEVHGTDTETVRETMRKVATGGCKDPEYVDIWLDMSFEIVKLWDSWGIPMKYKGKWDFGGHSFPGQMRVHMHYSGGNQKRVLTKETLKRNVKIMNRVTVFELLKDEDRIIGALGLDTWNDRIIRFETKSILLGTGLPSRLYPPVTPGWICNLPIFPFNTGDGRAMGLRAGASLTGLEFTGRRAGPKYFSRSGKATWIGVFRNPAGQPVGPFITKPNKDTGDTTSDVYPGLFHDYKTSARGPVYMDCRGASEEDMEDMFHWLRNEGNTGLLGHLKEEGIDPVKHGIEFGTYEFGTRGGVWHTTQGETGLKGLYAAGDEYAVLGGMAGSSIWGWIAGENMTKYSKDIDFIGLQGEDEKIGDAVDQLNAVRERQNGATWQEANVALQSVMSDYAGELRSHSMLEQGLLHLGRLKKKARDTLMAGNGHELGRCIEVLNLIELGQALIAAAMERKETRGPHKRADYPFTNPMLDQKLLLRKSGDSYSFEWGEKLI